MTVQNITNAAAKYRNSASSIYNLPTKHIVLPSLLIGNMAYKLGSEKNPERRNQVLWNSIISWLGGTMLYNANNKVLPYFTLPIVAGALALFKIAQKDTAEEKADTAINHTSWWLSGIATQKLSTLFKLKGPFHSICAFAVGASVLGPLISSYVKQRLIPKFGENQKQNFGSTFDNLNTGYNTGERTYTNFSPFTEPPPYMFNQSNQRINTNLQRSNYDPFDTFNLDSVLSKGLNRNN